MFDPNRAMVNSAERFPFQYCVYVYIDIARMVGHCSGSWRSVLRTDVWNFSIIFSVISVYRLISFRVASLQNHELPVADATGEGAAAVFRDNPGCEALSMYPMSYLHTLKTPTKHCKFEAEIVVIKVPA